MSFKRAETIKVWCFREGTFFIAGGGGGAWGGGLRRGGSSVTIVQIGEGQPCFMCNRGRVTGFFGKEKILHAG